MWVGRNDSLTRPPLRAPRSGAPVLLFRSGEHRRAQVHTVPKNGDLRLDVPIQRQIHRCDINRPMKSIQVGLWLVSASFGDPPFKNRDPLCGPGPVARHRPCFEATLDRGGMEPHVACRPEIEGEAHRSAIPRTEQAFDVSVEAQRFPGSGRLGWCEIRDGAAACGGSRRRARGRRRVAHPPPAWDRHAVARPPSAIGWRVPANVPMRRPYWFRFVRRLLVMR
jgi:hypothetical protein